MSVRGADGKFKSVGRKAKAPAAKKAKQTKKTTAKTAKRVATPKQLAALAKARATRTHAKLERMYGPGGGLPVGGPTGVSAPTTAGNAISSIVAADPYEGVKKGVNPYAPYLQLPTEPVGVYGTKD